jgi:hypothetical protein
MHRILRGLSIFAAALLVVPVPADAQYFGRNKVQYDQFDFKVLQTRNFDIHFYDEAAQAIEDAARMGERWYERLARVFEHDIGERRPLIFYASHPHFQQTNVLSGHIGEGTGGVTEGLRDRVIMPLGNSYADTDHVLGHELVHSFQFDLAGRRGGLQGLMRLPLWFVEGMAEYLSLGAEASHTAMWLRDAVLRDEFPTTQMMSRDMRRYFPYRFGHAFWAFVGGQYGDRAVGEALRIATRTNMDVAFRQVLGVSADTLSAQWKEAVTSHYGPLMEDRTPPGEAGTLLLSPETGAGSQNIAPALSPDGRYVAFLSEKDLFTIELFLADARTGEIVRRVTSAVRDAHFDAIRFLDSSGGWSPDGEYLAVAVFAEGRNKIQIYRARDGRRVQLLDVPRRIAEIRGPVYSPDGTTIAFSGQAEGKTDLFLLDIESGEVTQLTNDRHTQLQPTFSPDGRTLAFVTEMGPETDFELLVYGPRAIALMDLETRDVRRVAPLERADHWSPQFTPDGQGLFFLADPDGFRDMYRVDLGTGELWQVTRLATGVSGITASTPALTVARETGSVAFSVFDGGEYHIYALDAAEVEGQSVQPAEVLALAGRRLPGAPPPGQDRVETVLADAQMGLPDVTTYRTGEAPEFDPRLGLEWIGQTGVGVGSDQFGTFIAGAVAAQFSDMLGNRNVFAALVAQGELQDIGGQVFYQDVGRRWNWGGGVAHIPNRFLMGGRVRDPQTGDLLLIQQTERIFQTQASGVYQYPFSSIRRAEVSAGMTRWGFSAEQEIFRFSQIGQFIGHERVSLATPDALYLGQASLAFVEDNSFFGFTAPLRGWRARYEVSQTIGSVSFTQAVLDHRRYFPLATNLTLAVRGMHLGRYGLAGDDDGIFRPFFLGWETFIRGYAPGSFRIEECSGEGEGGCPVWERLMGQRLGVVNVEARIPFLGNDRLGLINAGFIPVDLALFTDAGLAWNSGDDVEFVFERDSDDRIPVFSTGVSARINLFGALILEPYWAYPWQRPDRGGHWGFNFAAGW